MTSINPIYVGQQAISKLLQYCQDRQLDRFTLVADTNTYPALGKQVEEALSAQGHEVTNVVLTGEEVIADEHYLITVLLGAQLGPSTFLAVGSGTLTDIARLVSHRTNRQFLSLPTAPSVDGFASIGAPLVLGRVKQTIISQPPAAIFADLQTLCEAPKDLLAAGYGDMLGKVTSLADWKLGALVWEEPFDEAIHARAAKALRHCIDHTEAIAERSPEGVRRLMEALIESGQCMLDFGSSRPASGAEHHASHYWEMLLLLERRPAILHGAKVGFAVTRIAKQYAQLRALSQEDVRQRLEGADWPDRDADIAAIRDAYGPVAEDVIEEHADFLNVTPARFETVKQRIIEHWDAIRQIAETVLPPEQLTHYLGRAGGPVGGKGLGLTEDEVRRGLEYGHYLRSRFTVNKLSRLLGIPLA